MHNFFIFRLKKFEIKFGKVEFQHNLLERNIIGVRCFFGKKKPAFQPTSLFLQKFLTFFLIFNFVHLVAEPFQRMGSWTFDGHPINAVVY